MNCDPCAIWGYRHDGRTVWVEQWTEGARGREADGENGGKSQKKKETNNGGYEFQISSVLDTNILMSCCHPIFPWCIWSLWLLANFHEVPLHQFIKYRISWNLIHRKTHLAKSRYYECTWLNKRVFGHQCGYKANWFIRYYMYVKKSAFYPWNTDALVCMNR